MLSIIEKKQAGGELTPSEIRKFVQGVAEGTIPDYQTSAFLMAVYFKGLSRLETISLTRALVESGETLSYPKDFGYVIDKHSTGGVGDKVTLVLVPLLASAGYKVPKMSGRGLGHTGGTIDKLESIPGFRAELTRDELFSQLKDVGCAIISQTENLVPAEKKLYAIRDATGTVNCLPLIVSSILSKKVAAGADAVVIDVKCGFGAFFKTYGEATAFATEAQIIAGQFPLKLTSVISDMNQPLGRKVGNALEVAEALEILEAGNPQHSVAYLAIQLSASALSLIEAKPELNHEERLSEALRSGKALEKFWEMVSAQGGSISDFKSELESIDEKIERIDVPSPKEGTIAQLNALTVGKVVHSLGGGRTKMEDKINPWVGVELLRKIGESVEEGEPIAVIYAPKVASPGKPLDLEELSSFLLSAYEIL